MKNLKPFNTFINEDLRTDLSNLGYNEIKFQELKDKLRERCGGYVDLSQFDDEFYKDFLSQSYVKGKSIDIVVEYLYDHIISQGLADVTP